MKSFFTSFTFIVMFLVMTFAMSFAQINWTKHADPVLNPGSSGSWDDGLVGFSPVIFKDNIYHLWYGAAKGHTYNSIGYAISTDGIIWTKYNDTTTTSVLYAESDPVLVAGQAGDWDDALVSCPYVLFHEGKYHMWYGGTRDPELYSASIGYATSTDGIHWQKDTLNNPVFTKGSVRSWDDTWVYKPFVLYIDGTFHLWYDAWNGTADQVRIGHATSPDGITWARDPNNPVLSYGSSQSWDYPRVEGSSVFYDGNTYHMWYSGGSGSDFFSWKIGYALSQDGSTWTKYEDNPVLPPGAAGKWDSKCTGFSRVLFDSSNSNFRMWYSGGNAAWDGHVGYATAPVTYKALFKYSQSSYNYQFTDQSVGIITDWLWDFSDGESSTLRNPLHSYNMQGTYPVTLIVSGPYGSDTSTIVINIVNAINDNTDNHPHEYVLMQNYPNPFNPVTTISYQLPKSSVVELSIYNLLGQKVATLVDKKQPAGQYQLQWDASGFASGVYYYKLTTENFQQIKKMLLVK